MTAKLKEAIRDAVFAALDDAAPVIYDRVIEHPDVKEIPHMSHPTEWRYEVVITTSRGTRMFTLTLKEVL
jgi:hypothetical protein